jgi:hypothetical protein
MRAMSSRSGLAFAQWLLLGVAALGAGCAGKAGPEQAGALAAARAKARARAAAAQERAKHVRDLGVACEDRMSKAVGEAVARAVPLGRSAPTPATAAPPDRVPDSRAALANAVVVEVDADKHTASPARFAPPWAIPGTPQFRLYGNGHWCPDATSQKLEEAIQQADATVDNVPYWERLARDLDTRAAALPADQAFGVAPPRVVVLVAEPTFNHPAGEDPATSASWECKLGLTWVSVPGGEVVGRLWGSARVDPKTAPSPQMTGPEREALHGEGKAAALSKARDVMGASLDRWPKQ